MPYQQLAKAVLEQWRDVERQIAALPPESAEVDDLKLQSYRLREEYQHLVEEAAAHHRPEPPAWPESPPSPQQ
jgi:hypothetical protein